MRVVLAYLPVLLFCLHGGNSAYHFHNTDDYLIIGYIDDSETYMYQKLTWVETLTDIFTIPIYKASSDIDSARSATIINVTFTAYADTLLIPPFIVLQGDNPLTLNVGQAFTYPGAIVKDWGVANELIFASDLGGLNVTAAAVKGTYTITYTANDDSDGNAADPVTRTVVVVPTWQIVFEDNFDRDDGDPGTDWVKSIFDTKSEIRSNHITGYDEQETGIFLSDSTYSYDIMKISYNFYFNDDINGLWVNYTNSQGKGYLFLIGESDRILKICKFTPGEAPAVLTTISDYVCPIDTTFTINIEYNKEESSFKYSILDTNGATLKSTTVINSDYVSLNSVGLGLESGGENFDADVNPWIDNFKIEKFE